MDRVGDGIGAGNAAWTFGGSTPLNFDQHVARSVPLYHESHQIALDLADFFATTNSVIYDLGCSTGSLTRQLALRTAAKETRVLGVDSVVEMIDYAQSRVQAEENVEFICDDISNMNLDECDYVVMFYTLQFIHPSRRQMVIDHIFQRLNWGGALLLVEKVRAPDARFQDIMSSLYIEYKLRNNFALEETAAKTRSLKGILEPFSSDGNLGLLKRAGFVDVMSVSKFICFEAFLAVK